MLDDPASATGQEEPHGCGASAPPRGTRFAPAAERFERRRRVVTLGAGVSGLRGHHGVSGLLMPRWPGRCAQHRVRWPKLRSPVGGPCARACPGARGLRVDGDRPRADALTSGRAADIPRAAGSGNVVPSCTVNVTPGGGPQPRPPTDRRLQRGRCRPMRRRSALDKHGPAHGKREAAPRKRRWDCAQGFWGRQPRGASFPQAHLQLLTKRCMTKR